MEGKSLLVVIFKNLHSFANKYEASSTSQSPKHKNCTIMFISEPKYLNVKIIENGVSWYRLFKKLGIRNLNQTGLRVKPSVVF